MGRMKGELERLVGRPDTTPAIAEEAGRLLLDVIRVEGRVDRFLATIEPGSEPGPAGFQGMPLQDAARRVLSGAGVPLHVRELAARVKAGGWRHRRESGQPDQLAHQLAARLPRYDTFRRVRPNTFGLAEWGEGAPPSGGQPVPLFTGTDRGLAEWIGEHPEAPFEDSWPSS